MSGGTPGSGWLLLAVLGAALLHASWNALIKSSTDKALDTGLIHGLGSLVAPPLLLWLGLPDAAAWPYILASTAIHIGYYTALAGAYKHGDLGLTYPLMRGCAPLLVALCSHALIGEGLSLSSWIGVLTICAGVLALGLSRHAHEGDPARRRKALRFALLNAVFIAGYTLVDGMGVRVSGDAGRYVAALFLLDGLPYLSLVLWQRHAQWPATRAYMAARWPVALGGTFASLGSYGIALWAMTLLPVAMVAALRETSVLFAALLGTLLLREPFGWQRAGGTAVIVAGIIVLRLH